MQMLLYGNAILDCSTTLQLLTCFFLRLCLLFANHERAQM